MTNRVARVNYKQQSHIWKGIPYRQQNSYQGMIQKSSWCNGHKTLRCLLIICKFCKNNLKHNNELFINLMSVWHCVHKVEERYSKQISVNTVKILFCKLICIFCITQELVIFIRGTLHIFFKASYHFFLHYKGFFFTKV